MSLGGEEEMFRVREKGVRWRRGGVLGSRAVMVGGRGRGRGRVGEEEKEDKDEVGEE